MKNTPLLVYCTYPEEEDARSFARQLVQQKLAACVNIVPGLESVYHWQDNIEQDSEKLLLIKTGSAQLPKLEKYIHNHHPYEVVEIIATEPDFIAADYLKWWRQSLSS